MAFPTHRCVLGGVFILLLAILTYRINEDQNRYQVPPETLLLNTLGVSAHEHCERQIFSYLLTYEFQAFGLDIIGELTPCKHLYNSTVSTFIVDTLYNYATTSHNALDLTTRLSIVRFMLIHGYYNQTAELCSFLLPQTNQTETRQELQEIFSLAVFSSGDWTRGTNLLANASNNRILQWHHQTLHKKQPLQKILPLYGPKISGNHVKYSLLQRGNSGENYQPQSPRVEQSTFLEAPLYVNYSERDIYLVEFINIEFEKMSLLHSQDEYFPLYPALFLEFDDWSRGDVSFVPIFVGEGVYISPRTNNYYHCVIESISRILLLEASGFFNTHPHAKILVNGFDTLLMQPLGELNISKERIILFGEENRLVVDSLYGIFDDLWPQFGYPCMHHEIPSREAIRLLNQYFNPNPLPLQDRKKIIYTPRDGASRRTLDFDEFFIFEMKRLYGDHFIVHDSSQLFVEQVKVFQRARIVIGPHGAGLANIVFASPNTTALIELPAIEPHLQFYYSHITASLDMYHWIVPLVNSTYYGNYPNNPNTVDILLSTVSSVARLLEQYLE